MQHGHDAGAIPGMFCRQVGTRDFAEGRQHVGELNQVINNPPGLLDAGRPAGNQRCACAGVGHGADGSETLSSLLPSLEQLGIPYVTISVSDLNAATVGGYARASGGYIIADGKEGAFGWTDNEID